MGKRTFRIGNVIDTNIVAHQCAWNDIVIAAGRVLCSHNSAATIVLTHTESDQE